MAIKFLGYVDKPEEMLGAKRRCVFGCDSSSDVASLPTTAGMTIPGGTSAVPAPWSYALVKGAGVYVMDSTGSWGKLNG